jgi:hypothetical protein
MPLLTELENVLGCDSTNMSPLTGLTVGVIFSGQNFYEAQIPNCESEKTHARPAQKTSSGSGEVKIHGHAINIATD